MRLARTIVGILAFIVACKAAAAPAEIHVSATGSDENPGTPDRPLKTLAAARDLARAKNPRQNGGVISLHAGTYRLRQTLALDERDSGPEATPIVYQAAPGEDVRICGGVALTAEDLVAVSDHSVVERLRPSARPRVREIDLGPHLPAEPKPWPPRFRGYAGWPELYLGDTPLRLARWPDKGYARIAKVIDRGSRPRWNEKPDRPGVFRYREPEEQPRRGTR